MTDLLRCPHCHRPLDRHGRVWRCPSGHAFDIARQGYVNLSAGRRAHAGDSPAMLDARAAVLDAGHFDIVTEAVIAACGQALPAGALVEVGAGTAHHLARVRRALGSRRAVAMDVSVAAARRAARADPAAMTAVVADAWQPWPVRDRVAAAVLTLFAPRNPAEAARVLVAGGRLVTVTPCHDHLAELVTALGLLQVEPGKGERLRTEAGRHLEALDVREVRATRVLGRDEARAVAAMGPSAHHHRPDDLDARVGGLPARVAVTIAVQVSRFQRR